MLDGHFSEVQKMNKANEAHKRSLRDKVKKNRKSFIGYKNKTELEFPKFSDKELSTFKEKLKSKRKWRSIITILVFIVIIIFTIIITNYILDATSPFAGI